MDLGLILIVALKGAPYGYTSFCSDTKKMNEFRFVLDSSVERGLHKGIPHFVVIQQKIINLGLI